MSTTSTPVAGIATVTGTEHDFVVYHGENGLPVAEVWHSDKGEWTIAWFDHEKLTHVRGNRAAAIARVCGFIVGLPREGR